MLIAGVSFSKQKKKSLTIKLFIISCVNERFTWVEKYRPQTIEDCILPDSIKKTFKDFLNTGEIPNSTK